MNNQIDVLDKGFVRLVDHYGSDARIVEAARVSYGNGTKTVREDQGLINYLMRNEHMSPFEMVDFTFHIKAPIFVARQWFRHRTASVNEISARYSVLPTDYYTPSVVMQQSKKNKQGSADPVDDQAKAQNEYEQAYQASTNAYWNLLSSGVSREQARTVLPVGIYTEFYWKQNLRNLMHFIKLRADSHAQHEIQVYATAMGYFISEIVPMAWDAFVKYNIDTTTFTSDEQYVLMKVLRKYLDEVKSEITSVGFTESEAKAFLAKLI